MEMSLIQRIISFIFGYRYYANIVNTKGIDKYEICSFIFPTKEEAMRHKQDLERNNRSFVYIETVRFRSKNVYLNSRLC